MSEHDPSAMVGGVPVGRLEAMGYKLSRPLLVGEANPYGNPRYALYPEPANSAGARLCERVLGMKKKEYIRTFDRVNLCGQRWSLREAREAAKVLARCKGRLVLFGAKVAQAFGLEFRALDAGLFINRPDGVGMIRGLADRQSEFFDASGATSAAAWLIVPHPSGLNRAWNEDGLTERAGAAIRAFCQLPDRGASE